MGIVALSGALGVYAKFIWPRQPEHRAMRDSLGEMRKVRSECWQRRPYSGALLQHPDCDLPRGAGSPKILVWGDSHASSMIPLVAEFAARHGTSMRIRFMPECPPLQDYSPTLVGVNRSAGCELFNRDVLAEVASLRSHGLVSVMIAAHWWAYLGNVDASRAAERGLQTTITELDRLGVRVLIVAPVPEYPHEVSACLARREVIDCGLTREDLERQRLAVMAMLGRAENGRPHVRIVDPTQMLCDALFCKPFLNSEVLFSDAHHLTVAGSLALLPTLEPELEWSIEHRARDAQTQNFNGSGTP